MADCGSDRDAAWLDVEHTVTTHAPGESAELSLTLDGDVDQPGTATAAVLVRGNTPYDQRVTRITHRVLPPRTWGAVSGTVRGTSCAGETRALAEHEVWIESRSGARPVTTDADGSYTYWLHVRENRLRLYAGDSEWMPESTTTRVSPGKVTTQDLTLEPIICS